MITKQHIKDFISLTKPGIIFGNVITLLGGFYLASLGEVKYGIFLTSFIGISLVIACGCVFNNYIDQDIDRLMERTRGRVLITGRVSGNAALVYATILGILGTTVLFLGTNNLTVIIALTGLFFYVVVYSLWLKRKSIYGTYVGSISGAVPPVVGYCAVSNKIDAGAIILFIILSLWQLPHSFAIAIYRFNDYKAANIQVLPVSRGIPFTKINMLIYVIAFVIATLMLTIFGYNGFIYFGIALCLGVYWIILALRGFQKNQDEQKWARKMFLFSIIVITTLSLTIPFDVIRHTA